MKTIRIRKFTILSLFFILILPWLFYVATHFLETKTFSFGMNDSQQENVEATIRLIETNTDNWTRPCLARTIEQTVRENEYGCVDSIRIRSGDFSNRL